MGTETIHWDEQLTELPVSEGLPNDNIVCKETVSPRACTQYSGKFDFLLESNTDSNTEVCNLPSTSTDKGILRQIGAKRSELHPREEAMYQIHRNVISKMSKLKMVLKVKMTS